MKEALTPILLITDYVIIMVLLSYYLVIIMLLSCLHCVILCCLSMAAPARHEGGSDPHTALPVTDLSSQQINPQVLSDTGQPLFFILYDWLFSFMLTYCSKLVHLNCVHVIVDYVACHAEI